MKVMLEENTKVKSYQLPDKDGELQSVPDINSKYSVVYFYPKDDTPGCTTEAQEFTSLLPDFEKLGVKVIGVSGGDEKSKTKFCSKYDLEVTLLSDNAEYEVCKAYQSYGPKKFMDREFMGILRNTFIVDSSGTVTRVFSKVKAKGHAEEVLSVVAELAS